MSAKITKRMIEKLDWDSEGDYAFMRELEMSIEFQGLLYSIQFFQDLQLYGLSGAISYAESYEKRGDIQNGVTKKLKKIELRIIRALRAGENVV